MNVGVYCFKIRDLFDALKCVEKNKKKQEFYLTDVIEIITNNGKEIKTVLSDGHKDYLGINNRKDLSIAEQVVRERVLEQFMFEGVTIIDPNTTYIDANVKIGQDTVLKPFTYIEKDVIIGKNCQIGPFARLRSGTKIEDNVEIGNFTEVSRTQIGKETRMKHFSYLGDAIVGSKANIGAGSVTANYDGNNKNVTNIGNNSFIGCDAVLVAPVKVGDDAVVGAGSVVTRNKNVPKNSVVYGIPAKIVKNKKSS